MFPNHDQSLNPKYTRAPTFVSFSPENFTLDANSVPTSAFCGCRNCF